LTAAWWAETILHFKNLYLKQWWMNNCLGGLASCIAFSFAFAGTCFAGTELSSAIPSSSSRGSGPVEKSEFDIPLEINGEAAAKLVPVPLYVNLYVPHHGITVTSCQIFPYPEPPPRPNKPMHLQDTNYHIIKKNIEQTCYTRKTLKVQAYPVGGWRWQYCYAAALKRCGQDEPHYLASFLPFVNAMLPYCHDEVLKSNEFEQKRQLRYTQAVDDAKALRADAETEATRRGLEPVILRFKKFFSNGARQGQVSVAAGQWWIVARHKVPGLTYYWQQPFTVHENENNVVTLVEDNALMIEGAW
jgi:hypothetical protein